MDTILPLIWQQFGSQWLAVAIGAGWLLHGTGLIGHLVGAQTSSADRTEERRQHLMDALIAEAAAVRERHAIDIRDWERRLLDAQKTAEQERINAMRWRHLLGTFGIAMTQRGRLLDQHGIPYPRVDYTRFIADGGDPGEFDGFL